MTIGRTTKTTGRPDRTRRTTPGHGPERAATPSSPLAMCRGETPKKNPLLWQAHGPRGPSAACGRPRQAAPEVVVKSLADRDHTRAHTWGDDGADGRRMRPIGVLALALALARDNEDPGVVDLLGDE